MKYQVKVMDLVWVVAYAEIEASTPEQAKQKALDMAYDDLLDFENTWESDAGMDAVVLGEAL